MREIRTSGSEGGARFYPLSLPYLLQAHAYTLGRGVVEGAHCRMAQKVLCILFDRFEKEAALLVGTPRISPKTSFTRSCYICKVKQ